MSLIRSRRFRKKFTVQNSIGDGPNHYSIIYLYSVQPILLIRREQIKKKSFASVESDADFSAPFFNRNNGSTWSSCENKKRKHKSLYIDSNTSLESLSIYGNMIFFPFFNSPSTIPFWFLSSHSFSLSLPLSVFFFCRLSLVVRVPIDNSNKRARTHTLAIRRYIDHLPLRMQTFLIYLPKNICFRSFFDASAFDFDFTRRSENPLTEK